jgi:TolB-like protein/class 3 adenylate cyclase
MSADQDQHHSEKTNKPSIRKLAAIMFTDIVGYSTIMGNSEEEAMQLLNINRTTHKSLIPEFGGKWLKEMGDGILATFPTVTDAVQCAIALQKKSAEKEKLSLRIGIHLGEVVFEENDVFGDGVNIAARLASVSNADEILVSESVYRNIENKPEIYTRYKGEKKLKNIRYPIRTYEVITKPGSNTDVLLPTFIPGIKSTRFIRILTLIILAIILLAGIVFIKNRFMDSSNEVRVQTSDITDKSIAVLPFQNLSDNPDEEYLADGITEDIITQLAKIKSFRVISRTSVMQFKNTSVSVEKIGRELGVSLILEGSIQRINNKIRINAQLISAGLDEHLWAETYDGSFDDIFEIQGNVARSIAAVLNTTLTDLDNKRLGKVNTHNLQAYEMYLQGKFYMAKRNKSDLEIAEQYFKQAISLDSSFTLAYTGLADLFLLYSSRGLSDPNKVLPVAKNNIKKASDLDPEIPEVLTSAGYYEKQMYNIREAERLFKKSIQLNPNQDNVYNWLGTLFEIMGKNDEAILTFEKGLILNPNFRPILQNRIDELMLTETDLGIGSQIDYIEKLTGNKEQQDGEKITLSRFYWYKGDNESAINVALELEHRGLLEFYLNGDNTILVEEVNNMYKNALSNGDYISPFHWGYYYAQAGAHEEARSFFARAVNDKDPNAVLILVRAIDPDFLIPQPDPVIEKLRSRLEDMIEY